MWRCNAIALIILTVSHPLAAQSPTFGVGRPPTAEEFRELATAIAPDGGGLPEGSGNAPAGREIFAPQCARAPAPKAEAIIAPVLWGGQAPLRTARPLKTWGASGP